MVRDSHDVGVHFLHVGKTGGTTLKKMVRDQNLYRTPDGRRLIMHRHAITLPDVLSWDPDNTAAFFLRDPIKRYVSGFNSRFREGAPTKSIPWKPPERISFQHFTTPNQLAEALYSDEPLVQDRALAAMNAIVHTRMQYTYWFRDPDYLESRLDRIAFLGLQEHYAEDVARFFGALGVRDEVSVLHRHEAPAESSTELSERARANLERWYAADTAIYVWALENRSRWVS
jgi:hypothetical protein